jgi:hypothetical protein
VGRNTLRQLLDAPIKVAHNLCTVTKKGVHSGKGASGRQLFQ